MKICDVAPIARRLREQWAVVASAALAALMLSNAPADAGSVDVTTHYMNAQRTGWNPGETTLNWTNVNNTSFGNLLSIPLDEEVDAQPLVVSSNTIGDSVDYPNDVVVVATENNTIYKIDSVTGSVLGSRNFGAPVPMSALPGGCNNNSAVVGINSTPVFDAANKVIYLVAYTYASGTASFWVHKVNFSDLSDATPPLMISGSATLHGGGTIAFDASVQRQRSALLFSQNKLYVAFGSFCDLRSDASRGWLFHISPALSTQVPLLIERQSTDQVQASPLYVNANPKPVPPSPLLSSIWMSGAGPAADANGSVYFVTGNSNGSRNSNYPDSVVKINKGASEVTDYFTPFDFASDDSYDDDFGSGGVLVVPDQPGGLHFAVAAGKLGNFYLINRDNMGKFVNGGPDVPPHFYALNCYCAPAYFVGSDNVPRIVTAGGRILWSFLLPSNTTNGLQEETSSTTSVTSASVQDDDSFMVSVSSNTPSAGATVQGSAIVWAVSHRTKRNAVTLYAFKADDKALQNLYSGVAGVWKNKNGHANIVPVVASGRVFVASYKVLNIFGLTAAGAAAVPAPVQESAELPTPAPVGGSQLVGAISAMNSDRLTLTLDDGKKVNVNVAQAVKSSLTVPLYRNERVAIEGAYDGDVFVAANIKHGY